MKILFYMGRNPRNLSGVSWKIWKIERKGRVVTAWWGPAALKNRKVVALRLQTKDWPQPSVAEAIAYERSRVKGKLAAGYQRRARSKSS